MRPPTAKGGVGGIFLPMVSQQEITDALAERKETVSAALHIRWWTIGLGLVLIVPNNY